MDVTLSRLWMLTGPPGVGKTAFCRLLVERARLAGWDVAGLLSPALVEAGVKTGILVEDLRTGEMRPLASNEDHLPFALQVGNWFFDRAAVEWGNHVLGTCLPCGLLIVDELGPLEFLFGIGWTAALSVLGQSSYRLGVVVVRPELQDIARTHLPVLETIYLDASSRPEQASHAEWERLSHASDA